MPEVDITKAAMEAAKKLNLKPEEEEEKSEEAADKEEEVEVEDKVPEEEEEVPEAEAEEEPEKKGHPKTVPYSRLAETIKKMRTYERALQMMLDQQTMAEATPKKEVVEEKEEPLKIPQFDSTEEAVTWLVKMMGEQQDKKIEKAIRKVVDPMKQSAAVERASKDIEVLAGADPKFFDYYDKMMEISRRNPGLSANEVYVLAGGKVNVGKKSDAKDVLKKVKEKAALKKKAITEKRSSAVDRMEVDAAKFKTVREAALHVAKKQGLID